jgi:hypothetical protein
MRHALQAGLVLGGRLITLLDPEEAKQVPRKPHPEEPHQRRLEG